MTLTIFFDMPTDKTAESIYYNDPFDDEYRVKGAMQNFKNEEKPTVWSITINGQRWETDANDTYFGDLVVNVTVENVYTGSEIIFEYSFLVFTAGGANYSVEYVEGDVPFSLEPGVSVTMDLYFDMPEDQTAQKLVYDETDAMRTTTVMFG